MRHHLYFTRLPLNTLLYVLVVMLVFPPGFWLSSAETGQPLPPYTPPALDSAGLALTPANAGTSG